LLTNGARWWDKGAGAATHRMVNLLVGLATPSSGARAGAIGVMVLRVGTSDRRRCRRGSGRWLGGQQGFRLDPPSCAPLYLCFPRQLFPQNHDASRRLDPKADLLSPNLHHSDCYLVPIKIFSLSFTVKINMVALLGLPLPLSFNLDCCA
jgi:hypothetical protein